jgi:hypothetical protein
MKEHYEPFHVRLQQEVEAEQPSPLTYDSIPQNVRYQIIHTLKKSINGERNTKPFTVPSFNPSDIWSEIYDEMISEIGLPPRGRINSADMIADFLVNAKDTALVLTTTEIALRKVCESQDRMSRYDHNRRPEMDCGSAIDRVNVVLSRANIGFEFGDGVFRRVDSDYLHAMAIVPALRLLRDAGFANAEADFQNAIQKYREKPEDKTVLTLANSAYESTLKYILASRDQPYEKDVDGNEKLVEALAKTAVIKSWQIEHQRDLKKLLKGGVTKVRNKEGAHGPEPDAMPVPAYINAYGLHLAASSIVMLVAAHNATPMPSS